MKSISNPNIQTAFEYLADTVIASMSHKQLWVCLNTTCIEHGRGTNWSPDPASDRDIAFFVSVTIVVSFVSIIMKRMFLLKS